MNAKSRLSSTLFLNAAARAADELAAPALLALFPALLIAAALFQPAPAAPALSAKAQAPSVSAANAAPAQHIKLAAR